MENKFDNQTEKKLLSKPRPYGIPPTGAMKIKSEPSKRKFFNLNEAVKSLDLALGRLKKSKLVYGEDAMSGGKSRRSGNSDIFMDVSCPSSNINPGIDNASLMSMNFSHYELIRNLSRSTSNSEGAFSGTTCNGYSPTDTSLKDEHLEKYFRSAEMWTRKCRTPNTVHFEVPEK